MLDTFIALLAAHLIADFILQTKSLAEKRKANFLILLSHIAIVTLSSFVLLGSLNYLIIGIIFVTHFAMDFIKIKWMKDNAKAFVIDQTIHILVLLGISLYWTNAFADGWWPLLFDNRPDILAALQLILVLISGLIASLKLGGILIPMVMEDLNANTHSPAEQGIRGAGQAIGYLERALILLLVLIGQPAGVGFLIATKSVLRFGDITTDAQNSSKPPDQRSISEYIIIGTFLSFGWGLLIAVLTKYGVDQYLLAGENA